MCSSDLKAKRLLSEAGFEYVEVPLAPTIRSRALGAISGGRTVPQVFMNGALIGGAEQLEQYLKQAA